jgi:glucan phosphoethanolaminetransferase (alkaline phosphatase superfamily)
MIQRIQSVWLFLASMISGLLFLPSTVLYSWGIPGFPMAQLRTLSAISFYPLLVIAAVMVLLPLIAIFMFKDRKRQRGMATMGILAAVSFALVLFMKIGNINNNTPGITGQQYGILGALVPVASIIFLILAIRGIRADEKVLKSYERLR